MNKNYYICKLFMILSKVKNISVFSVFSVRENKYFV